MADGSNSTGDMLTTLSAWSPAFEPQFTAADVAKMWKMDRSTIQDMFIDEPGVFKHGKQNRKDGRRDYVTLRIPASVVKRVYERRTQSGHGRKSGR